MLGISTGTSATSITDTAKAWTTDEHIGRRVTAYPVAGTPVYGVITVNGPDSLTVDRWYDPNAPGGAVGTTPTAIGTAYLISLGQEPGFYMAFTENGDATLPGETSLPGELTTNGWTRVYATFAHTLSASNFTLAATGSPTSGGPYTIRKVGVYNAKVGGKLLYAPLLSVASGPLLPGDTVTPTVLGTL
jgi:hypothetical protein